MNKLLTQFTHALIPEPYTILGIQLKPYSLGHLFLMKRFECGFANEDPNYVGSLGDLLLAIAICSRTYEDFLDFIRDSKEMAEWSAEWGKGIKQYLGANKSFHINEKFKLFGRYMKEGIIDFEYWINKESEDTTIPAAHWSHSVYYFLISELKYTETQALNCPISKALADYYKHCENQGVITLMNDEELEGDSLPVNTFKEASNVK